MKDRTSGYCWSDVEGENCYGVEQTFLKKQVLGVCLKKAAIGSTPAFTQTRETPFTIHCDYGLDPKMLDKSCAPGAVPEGQIRIYSMRFCPYAQRTRLVLHAKGIEAETVNIHLKEKPEWYLVKNPLGLVPTLEIPSGEVICESAITCEYLDEVYPEKKLFPSDPLAKAHQKMLLEDYSKVVPLFYKIPMTRAKGEDISALEVELKEKLSKLNKVLVNKKSTFFGGDSITMIDYLIWPWFERVEAWQLKQYLDGTPELNKWILHMQEDPAVKALMFSTDAHKAFFTSFLEGKPNYDHGL